MNTPSKPITLSAEEVRELQQGAVTIRRPFPVAFKGQPINHLVTEPMIGSDGIHRWLIGYGGVHSTAIPSPFGPPGTVLWVRETFYENSAGVLVSTLLKCAPQPFVYYRATRPEPASWRWRPATQMPQRASRLSLEITKQTVEQVEGVWFWVVEGRKV